MWLCGYVAKWSPHPQHTNSHRADRSGTSGLFLQVPELPQVSTNLWAYNKSNKLLGNYWDWKAPRTLRLKNFANVTKLARRLGKYHDSKIVWLNIAGLQFLCLASTKNVIASFSQTNCLRDLRKDFLDASFRMPNMRLLFWKTIAHEIRRFKFLPLKQTQNNIQMFKFIWLRLTKCPFHGFDRYWSHLTKFRFHVFGRIWSHYQDFHSFEITKFPIHVFW